MTLNANNQLLTFGNTTLTYDFHGNMTSATDSFGTATYTWDARNRMTGIAATGLARFTYDALGRRTNKTINGTVTHYLYDGGLMLQVMRCVPRNRWYSCEVAIGVQNDRRAAGSLPPPSTLAGPRVGGPTADSSASPPEPGIQIQHHADI